MSELRWNPILGEWTITATHRQERTFLPPSTLCPLCPTRPGGPQTEIPDADFDIVVFENRFATLSTPPAEMALASNGRFVVAPASGQCEVVVYSPEHDTTLALEPAEKIERLIRVWMDRFADLGKRSDTAYVLIFENKGEVMGVTLHHPHGQIYAYPFVPPVIQRELQCAKAHWETNSSCLYCDMLQDECADGARIVGQNADFVALIPFAARWPYEVHVLPKRHVQAIVDFTSSEQRALATFLKRLLVTFDAIFDCSFPYVMAIHQRPVDGNAYDDYHFHIEFYPPMRTQSKLKFLAGSELGAGTFINDTLPEVQAATMRALWNASGS